MKRCCQNDDIEYDDDVEISDGLTVSDVHNNQRILSNTIKQYITTNELGRLSGLTSTEIIEKIQLKLTESGFKNTDFYIYTNSYLIYEFFFNVLSEDKEYFNKRVVEHFEDIGGHHH